MRSMILPVWMMSATVLFAQNAPEAPVKIAVDIPASHALIEDLLADNAEITIVLSPDQSAHHFSLSPKQLDALSEADFVFGVGAVFLPEFVEAAKIVNPDAIKGYYDQFSEAGIVDDDPHLWMSRAELGKMQAYYAKILNENGIKTATPEAIQAPSPSLENPVPIISAHQAFGYYERENNIQSYGALHDLHDQPLPPRQLAEAIAHMENGEVRCLISDAAEHDHENETFIEDYALTPISFDVLGWQWVDEPKFFEAYFGALAQAYERCR